MSVEKVAGAGSIRPIFLRQFSWPCLQALKQAIPKDKGNVIGPLTTNDQVARGKQPDRDGFGQRGPKAVWAGGVLESLCGTHDS